MPNKKILIASYSWSGNTKHIADLLAHITSGTAVQLLPVEPYPKAYNACVDQAKKEIKAGHRPAIQPLNAPLEEYDTVLLGSPNWWSSIAPPVSTFLADWDWKGKTIAPFFTHGGGGLGHMVGDTASLCPGADMRDAFAVYGNGERSLETDLRTWLKKIQIL